MIKIKCSYCKKIFYRSTRRVNEAKKFKWKQFCSKECLRLTKYKRKLFNCSNPGCRNTFKRSNKEIALSGNVFCSRSCSAIFNNSLSPKRKPQIRICPLCNEKFIGRNNYCSGKCIPKTPIVSKQKILQEIKEFFEKNKRIPVKKEFYHAKAARLRFGTWNNAVKTAGFEPNPVMFAKKCVANDGHKCDSFSEKVIDDWLFEKKIPHERNIPYEVNKMTADFKVDDVYIEFLGLRGELRKYDRLTLTKEKLWKKKKIKIIKIFPKDIFPINRLNKTLSMFNK